MSAQTPHPPGQETDQAASPVRERTGFAEVLADREFRALWVARILSSAGDQIARVALSVLVYTRTGSTTITALSYAMTFLPWIIGGPLLSGLADRWPRRSIMLLTDVLRGGLVVGAALSAVASVPLFVPLILIFIEAFLTPGFEAARAALIPTLFADDRYVVASALQNVTGQTAQVMGFALGGGAVAAVGARRGLALDAATFALSAALIWLGVRRRPAAFDGSIADGHGPLASWRADLLAGTRLILVDPVLRTLVLLAGLATFLVVPEALAVPVATTEGGGAGAVGLLLAAAPCGTVFGGLAITRLVAPDRRRRWIAPLAIAAGLPLVACVSHPGLLLTGMLWAISGILLAYQIPANAAFAVAVPDRRRGQAIGVVQTGLAVGQGLGLLAAGILADTFPPMTVIAGFGFMACALSCVIVATGQRLVS